MGLGHSPRIVTDGLVLGLDAGNPKNYNVGISTNWTDKVGGNNGTLVGGTYHNDGPFVGAGYVKFVESNDDGFNVSNSTGWFNPNNTSQWTLEGWILNPSSTNKFSIYSGTNNSIANFGCSIGGAVAFQSGNGAWAWVTNSTIVADTGSPTGWNHFAFTKNGSTFEVFLNGSRIYTGTPTFGTGGTGGSIHLQSYFSDGNYYEDAAGLSNVRYVTGSVLYSGTSYTVPTKPFTAISGTQLLIYQGNTFTDASSNNLTLTKQNSPTANLGSPASAFEFDGTDDYILLDSGLGIGTDDFTISVWVKFDSVSGVSGSANYRTVLSSYSGGNGYIFGLWISGDPVFEHYMDGTSYKGNTTIVAGTWYNMVSTRLSGDLYLYLNGSLDNTPVSASTKDMADTATPRIGWIPSASQNGRLDGTVSDLKIYKGKGLTAAEVTQNYNATKGRYA